MTPYLTVPHVYCLYQTDDEPIQCHRPQGHGGEHSEFAHAGDFPIWPNPEFQDHPYEAAADGVCITCGLTGSFIHTRPNGGPP